MNENDKNARQLKNVLLCQKLRIFMNLQKKNKKIKKIETSNDNRNRPTI